MNDARDLGLVLRTRVSQGDCVPAHCPRSAGKRTRIECRSAEIGRWKTLSWLSAPDEVRVRGRGGEDRGEEEGLGQKRHNRQGV